MTSVTRSARLLRLAAVVMLAATLATWLATGAHRGWTRTSIVEMQHDEVTGIDYPTERTQFVAGIDVLAAGVGFAAALGATSLLLRRRPTTPAIQS